MAVIKMSALTLIGPKDEMCQVAKHIVLSGLFQPLSIDSLLNDRGLVQQLSVNSENPFDELLDQVSMLWNFAGAEPPEPKPTEPNRDFTLSFARMQTDNIKKRLNSWEEKKEQLSNSIEISKAQATLLEALEKTSYHISDLHGKYIKFAFGCFEKDNFKRFCDNCTDILFVSEKLHETEKNVWELIIFQADNEDKVRNLFHSHCFTEYDISEIFNNLNENPKETIVQRIKLNSDELEKLSKTVSAEFEDNREAYINLYSQIHTMHRIYEVCKKRGELKNLYVLSGWLPEDSCEQIKDKIAALLPNTTVIFSDAHELQRQGIKVPTKLKNIALLRPFQEIVAMYSLPSYGEFDPTSIVALTFILFFGMMFGDIGHGLLMFLGVAYLTKRGIMGFNLGRVMQYASASSMIFGVLYGSVFGQEDIIHPLWLNPMESSNALIAYAICAGAAAISLGMIVNMAIQFKAKNYGKLLFDGLGLAGLLLYWALCALGYIALANVPVPPQTKSYLLISIGVLLLVMLFKDVLARVLLMQKEEGEGVVLSFFEIVHNLLSFLSNTTSFVRLAAFALNHVGLSIAVIMLSEIVQNVPGGFIFKAAMLVIGNIVIVALEGLIVFIQTLRLEYYEFFSKFFKGGGVAYKPISWKRERKILCENSGQI